MYTNNQETKKKKQMAPKKIKDFYYQGGRAVNLIPHSSYSLFLLTIRKYMKIWRSPRLSLFYK